MLADRGELIVVAGLGSPCYDVRAAGDHHVEVFNWGAMGSAVMVGLGLALARPDQPVLVLIGDGEMLMGIGSLASLVQHQPANLSIVILDNEEYAETGMRETAIAFGVDLAAIAAACATPWTKTLTGQRDVLQLRKAMHMPDGLEVAS
ncbi:MAG: thiamine pyrophosphate-dependent enzyme [Pseudomonadota bacterium]